MEIKSIKILLIVLAVINIAFASVIQINVSYGAIIAVLDVISIIVITQIKPVSITTPNSQTFVKQ